MQYIKSKTGKELKKNRYHTGRRTVSESLRKRLANKMTSSLGIENFFIPGLNKYSLKCALHSNYQKLKNPRIKFSSKLIVINI